MDGYKDGDRRRSDALEVTRPLIRGSRGPLRKTPPATCHAALIGNCQCETGNTFTLATFTTPCAPPIKIKISHKSLYNATKFHTLLEVSPQKLLNAAISSFVGFVEEAVRRHLEPQLFPICFHYFISCRYRQFSKWCRNYKRQP